MLSAQGNISETIQRHGVHVLKDNVFISYNIIYIHTNCFIINTIIVCTEATDPLGLQYRGTKNVTESGRTCQRWDTKSPHNHTKPNYEVILLSLIKHNFS